MTPTTTLPEPPIVSVPTPAVAPVSTEPQTEEARDLAAWYASDEFAHQLHAAFEQARLAAIASNPPVQQK